MSRSGLALSAITLAIAPGLVASGHVAPAFAAGRPAPSPAPVGRQAGTASPEDASAAWSRLLRKEGRYYRLSVPAAWRPMTFPELEAFYEASGTVLPVVYNGGPVIVTVFLEQFPAKSLEAVKEDLLAGYTDNPGRLFPKGFRHGQEPFVLRNGTRAYLLSTRFYRKSKGLEQSGYDLAAFSEKGRQGFMYALSVQYADESYEFEKMYELKRLAKTLFTHFETE